LASYTISRTSAETYNAIAAIEDNAPLQTGYYSDAITSQKLGTGANSIIRATGSIISLLKGLECMGLII
jgi:hypothetical protein